MARHDHDGPDPAAVSVCADQIEAELQRVGVWRAGPLPPERMNFTQAFGADTMAFTEWLQFVFLPAVREAVAVGHFPRSSQVGTYAVREFDGWTEGERLTSLLCEFDAMFPER